MYFNDKIKNKLELNEKYAFALLCYCNSKKMNNDTIQKMVDTYCSNMADSFLKEYSEALKNPDFITDLHRYLHSTKADEKYSGKRFGYMLYKKLKSFNKVNTNKDDCTL